MAAYLQLFKKNADEATRFQDIDVEICKMLGAPVDPVKWCCGWYDIIAFMLALGRSYEYIRSTFYSVPNYDPTDIEDLKWRYTMLLITDFLEENYRPDAWHGR